MILVTFSGTIIWILYFKGRILNSWLDLFIFFLLFFFVSFHILGRILHLVTTFSLFFWFFLISYRFCLHPGGTFFALILVPRLKLFFSYWVPGLSCQWSENCSKFEPFELVSQNFSPVEIGRASVLLLLR